MNVYILRKAAWGADAGERLDESLDPGRLFTSMHDASKAAQEDVAGLELSDSDKANAWVWEQGSYWLWDIEDVATYRIYERWVPIHK